MAPGVAAASLAHSFTPGAKVWIAEETQAWGSAEVVRTEGEDVVLKVGKETKKLAAKDVYLAEPRTAGGVEDMVRTALA